MDSRYRFVVLLLLAIAWWLWLQPRGFVGAFSRCGDPLLDAKNEQRKENFSFALASIAHVVLAKVLTTTQPELVLRKVYSCVTNYIQN